jgi:multidrug efflux pump subunit AcrB
MRIRTADGTEVPFSSVAKVSMQRGMSKIERVNGKRVVRVIADVDRTQTTPEEVLARLRRDVFPHVEQRWQGVGVLLAGEAETRDDAMGGLVVMTGFCMLLVFGLLAIPLKSYIQPLVVMSVIPFGAVGAMLGHFVLDADVVFFSLLGVVALAGVVVNASLVLVDKANRLRLEGMGAHEAIIEAACERFKPIVLTTGTTFVGLLPLMSSDDFATSMFVPMAISLGAGVLFSSLISLALVPSLYRVVEDGPLLLQRSKRAAEHLLRWSSDGLADRLRR